VGDISLNKQYSAGGHYGSIEVGFKTWDARKDQVFTDSSFGPDSTLLMSSFLSSFRNNRYYLGGRYQFGPTTDYNKILAYFNANPGQFSGGFDPVGSLPNDFDDSERIYAGYVMNTISLGRLRLQTGVRVESTNDSLLGTLINLDDSANFIPPAVPLPAKHNYTDVFPSVQAQYRIGTDTILRGSYGMGIARPNFYDMSPYLVFDPTNPNVPVSAGNPLLKPTHAQNFDVLIEHYLKPVGILQAGFFYKYLTDPIFSVTIPRTAAPYNGDMESTLVNGPSAHIAGIEMTWEQQLRFLPGLLNGMGVRANYGYTTSRASFPGAFGRTDHPNLVRTAPNNWNVDITYDKKGLSARMGLTHNDAYIWSYAGSNATKGPDGDTYIYPHTQVDAQVSYLIPRSHGVQAVVSMLNLNNEVFGFYNGSERFPIQREYYSQTISAGLRWTLPQKEK
jgi:TonB-dependent receptor